MTTTTRNSAQPDMVLFGLRWLIPLAIVVDAGLRSAPDASTVLSGPVLGLVLAVTIYNLVVLLTINTKKSQLTLAIGTVAMDALLSVAIVALLGPSLVWVALLPSVVAGARFGSLPGLVVAGGLGIFSVVVAIVFQGNTLSAETIAPAVLAALLLPAAALASGVILQSRVQSGEGSTERMELRLKNVREQMRVVYEMASTLSTSLNYSRVLDMVMEVSVHGLERLGMGARVAGAVLLFAEENGETFLRVATCRRLTPADARATVPGLQGVIGDALKQAEPIANYDPHDDPELKFFAAFRESKAVLCIPMRAGFESFGVLVLGVPVRRRFRADHIELMQAVANQAIVAIQNASLYQTLLEEKERIIGVDEEARKQLARDLHDGPTQTISAVAMRVSFIRRLLESKPEQAGDELWKVEEMARKAAGEIRHMLFTLRPLVLESQGLSAALDQLAAKMLETHDQKVLVKAEPHCEDYLDQHTQGVMFYIVEEALNNARKHAEADLIDVRLSVKGDVIVLEIEDNGKGFDLGSVSDGYEDRGSLGMVNLRERAELVEGTLHIDTAPGKGTRISVVVPLARSGGKLPSAQRQH